MTVTCPAADKGNADEESSLGDKGDWFVSCPETASELVNTGNGAAGFPAPDAPGVVVAATVVAADVSEGLERELRMIYIC